MKQFKKQIISVSLVVCMGFMLIGDVWALALHSEKGKFELLKKIRMDRGHSRVDSPFWITGNHDLDARAGEYEEERPIRLELDPEYTASELDPGYYTALLSESLGSSWDLMIADKLVRDNNPVLKEIEKLADEDPELTQDLFLGRFTNISIEFIKQVLNQPWLKGIQEYLKKDNKERMIDELRDWFFLKRYFFSSLDCSIEFDVFPERLNNMIKFIAANKELFLEESSPWNFSFLTKLGLVDPSDGKEYSEEQILKMKILHSIIISQIKKAVDEENFSADTLLNVESDVIITLEQGINLCKIYKVFA